MIVGCGLPRTGTSSLEHALRILGYKVTHNAQPWEVFNVLHRLRNGVTDAVTDVPFSLLPHLMPAWCPVGQPLFFIYTERHLVDWLASCEAYKRLANGQWPFSPTAEFFQKHAGSIDALRDQFQVLDLNICAGQGWGQLCPYLDKPIPTVPFPHMNTGTYRA